jgi:hypothetical protein
MTISSKLVVALTAAALVAACAAEDDAALCAAAACEPLVVVARSISFATEQADGVSEGFDLDGLVSDGTDAASCRQQDYTSPAGVPGIDNQFSILWEAITNVIDDAVDGLVRGAINDGSLVFVIELSGVDDRSNDDCVDLRILLGAGKPDIGTDGYITSGQTFDVAPGSPQSYFPCATIRAGVLEAGPFDGEIPVSVLDFNFTMRVYDAYVRAALHEDGSMTATLGAALEAEQIIEIGESADYRLVGLVSTLVRNRADLDPNELGECQKMSATLLLEGVSAFLYADAAR